MPPRSPGREPPRSMETDAIGLVSRRKPFQNLLNLLES
jgi:hypothetical protein